MLPIILLPVIEYSTYRACFNTGIMTPSKQGSYKGVQQIHLQETKRIQWLNKHQYYFHSSTISKKTAAFTVVNCVRRVVVNIRSVLRRQSRDTNQNVKRSVYCQYGQYSLTFRALALRQRQLLLQDAMQFSPKKNITGCSQDVRRPQFFASCNEIIF